MSLVHNNTPETLHMPTVVSTIGALLVGKLKQLQGSLVSMAGLSNTSPESELSVSNTRVDAAGTSSQPCSIEPTASDAREHRKAAMLSIYGIKVRDFAYESKLPPVPSYRKPVVAGPRTLKRLRKDYEEEISEEDNEIIMQAMAKHDLRNRSNADHRPAKRARLERTVTERTEPLEESQSQPETGYSDISQIPKSNHIPFGSQPLDYPCTSPPRTPLSALTPLPRSPFDRIQTPRIYWSTPTHPTVDTQSLSHDDEPWVDTPKVSPNESFDFSDTSRASTPALQSPSRNSFSNMALPDMTLPSIHFSPSHSRSQSQHTRIPLRRKLSRSLSRMGVSPRLSRSPSLRQLQAATSRSHISPIRRLSNGSLPVQAAPQPRYHLRDRSRITRVPSSRMGPRTRMNSRASSSSNSPRRPGGKARSSLSKGATKNAGKATVVPKPKTAPVLRRSARTAGMRL